MRLLAAMMYIRDAVRIILISLVLALALGVGQAFAYGDLYYSPYPYYPYGAGGYGYAQQQQQQQYAYQQPMYAPQMPPAYNQYYYPAYEYGAPQYPATRYTPHYPPQQPGRGASYGQDCTWPYTNCPNLGYGIVRSYPWGDYTRCYWGSDYGYNSCSYDPHQWLYDPYSGEWY